MLTWHGFAIHRVWLATGLQALKIGKIKKLNLKRYLRLQVLGTTTILRRTPRLKCARIHSVVLTDTSSAIFLPRLSFDKCHQELEIMSHEVFGSLLFATFANNAIKLPWDVILKSQQNRYTSLRRGERRRGMRACYQRIRPLPELATFITLVASTSQKQARVFSASNAAATLMFNYSTFDTKKRSGDQKICPLSCEILAFN
jgi:hypothetical protein